MRLGEKYTNEGGYPVLSSVYLSPGTAGIRALDALFQVVSTHANVHTAYTATSNGHIVGTWSAIESGTKKEGLSSSPAGSMGKSGVWQFISHIVAFKPLQLIK